MDQKPTTPESEEIRFYIPTIQPTEEDLEEITDPKLKQETERGRQLLEQIARRNATLRGDRR